MKNRNEPSFVNNELKQLTIYTPQVIQCYFPALVQEPVQNEMFKTWRAQHNYYQVTP